MTREQALRELELREEIPEIEKRLAYLINRRRAIEHMDAKNAAYKRKLLDKYMAEIRSTTDYLANLKSEQRDFEEMRLPKA